MALSLIKFYITKVKPLITKRCVDIKNSLADYWNVSSGDWHWLAESPMPVASLNRHLWRLSVPSFSFHFLLGASSIIATLGMLANSVAVIIGAMIIAPLMGPIIGMAYAIVMGNRRLLRRSSLTILTGVILTIFIAFLSTLVLGLKNISPEISSRANPTLIDLGVALAAGAAGAFANSRRRIADALPGVAISVALVPPLGVVGIGLALGQERLSFGAMLLFITNLTAIIFSGGLVFLLQSYGSIRKATNGLCVSVIILCLLGLPLGLSLRNILIKQYVHDSVTKLIRRRTLTFAARDIREIRILPGDKSLLVELEVAAPLGSITERQVGLVKKFLENELGETIDFKVRIIPVDIFESKSQQQK
ncbi:MAG: TIGR00341 family protein [Calothrix sp. MO_167.B12]|nr:TIGR00341 family protein [Calothrix sp. MO_167.B12]